MEIIKAFMTEYFLDLKIHYSINNLHFMKTRASLLLIVILAGVFSAFMNSSGENWELYKEINGVKIYTRKMDCLLQDGVHKNQYLIFKYENNTKKPMRVSGRVDVWYNGNCRSCDLDSPNEYEFSIDLPAGESREGNCSDELPAFKLYRKMSDSEKVMLTKFELRNLNVTEIK